MFLRNVLEADKKILALSPGKATYFYFTHRRAKLDNDPALIYDTTEPYTKVVK